MRTPILLAGGVLAPLFLTAQCDRWQQRLACVITVDLDLRSPRFSGEEALTYWNNSPDTIRQVFFHIHFNAFRPGSEMDIGRAVHARHPNVHITHAPLVNISSTRIRRMVHDLQPMEGSVPPAVEGAIREKGLYKD